MKLNEAILHKILRISLKDILVWCNLWFQNYFGGRTQEIRTNPGNYGKHRQRNVSQGSEAEHRL